MVTRQALLALLTLTTPLCPLLAEDNPMKIFIGLLSGIVIGGGVAYSYKDSIDDFVNNVFGAEPIKKAKIFCNTLEEDYQKELNLAQQYEAAHFQHNKHPDSYTTQMLLKTNIVESFLGHGTDGKTDQPLHFQETHLNAQVIKNLDQHIKTLSHELQKTKAKLARAQEPQKAKLLAYKNSLEHAILRCRNNKKNIEILRAAIITSTAYKHEILIPPGSDPEIKKTTKSAGSEPHPQQQEKMQNNAKSPDASRSS